MDRRAVSWSALEKWRTISSKQAKRRIPVGKAERLYDDITCLSLGIKRALLLDYLIIERWHLNELLKLWNEQSKLIVIVINDDTFIINKTFTASDRSTSRNNYINLTQNTPLLKSLPNVDNCIEQYVTRLIHSTLVSDNVSGHDNINYCAVYGWVLGYPLIYWDNEADCDYNINIEEVVQCRVTVASPSLWQQASLLL